MHPREAILQRLKAIAADFNGIKTFRNDISLPDTKLDAIILLDADEKADESDPVSRNTLAPRRVTMQPQLLISLAKEPKNVGPALNAVQAKLIRTVLTDQQLLALTLNGCGVRYGGSQTALAWGRTMFGEMAVSFSITYLLEPAKLAD